MKVATKEWIQEAGILCRFLNFTVEYNNRLLNKTSPKIQYFNYFFGNDSWKMIGKGMDVDLSKLNLRMYYFYCLYEMLRTFV